MNIDNISLSEAVSLFKQLVLNHLDNEIIAESIKEALKPDELVDLYLELQKRLPEP